MVDGTAEMVVHGNYVPGPEEGPHDYVLSGASLMRGHYIALAEHIEYGLFEALERLAAGVGVIGPHHCGQLKVAHGIGTAVGQHVHIHVSRIHAVCIESALFQGFQSFVYRQELYLLHDTRAMKLQWNIYAGVESYFWHFYIF